MNASLSASRYDVDALRRAVDAMFQAAGLEPDKARSVAQALVTADMMGHATHGLALAPWYFDSIAAGGMTLAGDVEVVADRGACVTWNGRRLPGAWLIPKAIALAAQRVETHGVVTVSISDSHHTGALAAYLGAATERGLMVLIACSGPTAAGVAPYGGLRSLFTPNPLAAGIPTDADPILLDISAAITTNNRARQLAAAGGRFPGPGALDAHGRPSDDPACLADGSGSLLPVGGIDHGHKGYSMALLVEALTQGIAGRGRSDGLSGTITSVFIQVLDPGAFGGVPAFKRQTSWLADACRSAEPRPGVDRVRVPGDQAAATRREAERSGVPLGAAIVAALRPYAERFGCTLPPALAPAETR